jgi:EmrB/QacA subfamily drug resistance transporter
LEDSSFAIHREPRLRVLIPLVVAFAFLMEQLDSTIITTAIPDIARSLYTTPVRMNLAVSAYVVTLAVFIPLSGWFADRFGARRIFVAALTLFTVASALCGLAGSFAMLIATRVLQGLGGAMMTPVGRLILLRSFPRSEFVSAMTYMTLPAIIGPVIGPLLGGVLTTYTSWRWIFYVNLPFGILGVLLALRFLDEAPGDSTAKFDLYGFLMFGGGVGLVQVGIEAIGRPTTSVAMIAGLFGAAALLLAGFARHAHRTDSPVIDPGLFRQRTFAVGTLAGGACRVAMNGTPFLLPLMLQIGFGISPVGSGSLTFLSSAGAVGVRFFIGPLLRRYGFGKLMIAGSVAGAATLASFALLEPDSSRWTIAAVVIVFGLVRSIQFMTSNTLSYSDMPGPLLSRATSLGGLIQQLTVSFGVSLSAVLLSLLTLHGATLTPARFHLVFLVSAVLPLLVIPGFLRLRPTDGAQASGHRPVDDAGAPGP